INQPEIESSKTIGRKNMRNNSCASVTHAVKVLGLCLFVILTIAPQVSSQTQITTGNIQGTVTDTNGGAVPGANVEIKNLETNLSKTLTTDEGGRFVSLALPP